VAFAAALPDLPPAEREALTGAAARSLFRLMAYKDEYEVARLLSATAFRDKLDADWDGGRVVYHLAPPFLPARKDARGRPVKRSFGGWLTPMLRLLARGKALRGTAFDPFGRMAERREERELITWFEDILTRLPALITRPAATPRWTSWPPRSRCAAMARSSMPPSPQGRAAQRQGPMRRWRAMPRIGSAADATGRPGPDRASASAQPVRGNRRARRWAFQPDR
jgi:hypothetical protein